MRTFGKDWGACMTPGGGIAPPPELRPTAGLGYPLYVNGRLFPESVTISHVPGAAPVGEYYDVAAGFGNLDPSMGAYVSYRANLGALGADEVLPGSTAASLPPGAASAPGETIFRLWSYVAPISALACAYHGYKRNRSVGWALLWGVLGGMPVTPVIALAQGFGKPKEMTQNPRRARGRVTVKRGRSGNIIVLKGDLLDDAENLHYPEEFSEADKRLIKRRVAALRKEGWKPTMRRRRNRSRRSR